LVKALVNHRRKCALVSVQSSAWMCNLYAVTKGQQAIREVARAMLDRTGNLPPLLGVFPDYPAPIVRNAAEGRELTMAGGACRGMNAPRLAHGFSLRLRTQIL
jgi:hypothetical protein